jgi:PAS domain S-box-containing protein
MTRKRTSFVKLIQLWGPIFLIGIGLSIVALDVISSYRYFNLRADQMRSNHIAHQKQIIRQEVKRVVDLISYEKSQSNILTREKIKSRVYEAYAIAQNIYQQNKAIKTDVEIQKMIIDALRPIRFQRGSGYYFITRTDGTEILFAAKPEMEGKNLLNIQDRNGQYVVRDMIEIAKKSGEGVYEYRWSKPDAEGNNFKKISFIKLFEPYNWFIGTGLYVVDVENQIKKKLLSTISRVRFGKEGYIFINRLNGDVLVSNGKLYSGKKKLWEVFNKDAAKTKAIFEKEYHAALKPDGDYIYYSWKKLTDSTQKSPKSSFIFGIPDLQWLVGAGVYLDDVETDITLMQNELNNQIKIKLLYFTIIVMGIVAIFLLFFNSFGRRLNNDLKLFFSFFKRAARSDKKINREAIRFVELDQMAEYANKMLADRKKTEAALRQSEEKYRNLFENLYDIYFRTDEKGCFTLLSPSVEKYLGYTSDELIGQNTKSFYIHPQERDRFKSLLIKNKHVENFEVQYRRKDNSVIWVSINAELLADEEGNFKGVEGITRDVSERKRIEYEKEKVEAQLQQSHKMEAIGTLAGGIAHDFNNVLFSIIGFTELTMDDVPKGSLAHENLQEVLNGAMRASEMVQQILAFSRNATTEKKPIKVQSVVKEALKLLRTSIPSTIEIHQNIDEGCRPILADSTQIHQVIMNLATNAYQAMPEGGVLNVTLREGEIGSDDSGLDLQPGTYLKLAVRDTGHGIDSAVIRKIFDPYFSTKEPGKGTGMGLSVVHGITKSHGGDIKVTSRVGKGTVFEVYLPLIETGPVKSKEIPSGPLPTGTEHILLVDDEEPIALMASQMLERLGYQVTFRTSSVEALKAFEFRSDEYDLVITDMTMPNMTGADLAPRLRKIRPDIPIIICTGFSEKIDEEKAKSLGISGYIMKPILKDEISRIIRKVLDGEK